MNNQTNTPNQIRRVLLPAQDKGPAISGAILWNRGQWPARWLIAPAPCESLGTMGAQAVAGPYVMAFRLRVMLDSAARIRIHVSGDERYKLFADGVAAHVGPERGHPEAWRFATFDLDWNAGEHWLALRLWVGGTRGPVNQTSVRPGIIVASEVEWQERIATGTAPWECRLLEAYAFETQPLAFFSGARTVLNAARLPWGWETGAGNGFVPAMAGPAGHTVASVTDRVPPVLTPECLPPQVCHELPNGTAVLVDTVNDVDSETPPCHTAGNHPDERTAWQAFLDGHSPLILPPATVRRCLIDLGVYRACWPRLSTAGAGGKVRLRFAEGLYVDPNSTSFFLADKGNRADWCGKVVRGLGPCLLTATGPARTFDPLDWECGRWLEIVAMSGAEPLRLETLTLQATGYPFSEEAGFASDDERLGRLRDLCIHTLRVGTHETYCDCPYYERLQYVGDTRLEVLATYVLQADDRLPRQAIEAFSGCRQPSGLVPSRSPGRGLQIVPPFALWWIHMVQDHALWRDDPAFVRAQLPVMRSILDAWWGWRNTDSLIEAPVGWNFVDWVPSWSHRNGMPAGADTGVSAILNWHYAWTLRVAAELEESLGEAELGGLYRRRAAMLVEALRSSWDPAQGRWRDSWEDDAVSEHGQILPLLSGLCDPELAGRTGHSLMEDPDLARTTIYFTHYLFEAYRLLGRGDRLAARLALWHDLPARGLTTTPEMPEPTRSDCHPWGTHPMFHMAATLTGLRPASIGFSRVSVAPIPKFGLRRITADLPHPRGRLAVALERSGACWRGQLETPVPAQTPTGDLPPGIHKVEWPA